MALNVQLNLRVSSTILGTINSNYSYFDPLTGTNLTKNSLISGDLSAFSQAQLVNIANAVYAGTLSVVPASTAQAATAFPAHSASYSLYNEYFYKGTASGSFVPSSSGGYVPNYANSFSPTASGSEIPGAVKLGQGITGVAAADLLENNF
jgi:hypothetical protein